MNELVSVVGQPYLLEVLVFAATLCLVFGMASLLQPVRRATGSVRRARPMQWMAGFSGVFAPSDPAQRELLRIWLLQAGYEAPSAVDIYCGIRLLLAIGLAAAFVLILPAYTTFSFAYTASAALLAAPLGFLAPVYVFRVRRTTRLKKFREGLPDVLDLLLVCSEAGLGIDMALLTVGEELSEPHPLLAKQLQHVSTLLRAGCERRDAMRSLAERTGIEETISLVNLLIQSDRLGTSMAQTLRIFSDDMRAHRMLRAEEQGHKVSTKLTVILVAFFLPAIFAALLAPAVYSAVKTMQSMSQVHAW
jgi:tight adherence protein C